MSMSENTFELSTDLQMLITLENMRANGVFNYYIQKMFSLCLNDDIDLDILMKVIELDSQDSGNNTDIINEMAKLLQELHKKMKDAYNSGNSIEEKKKKVQEVWNNLRCQFEDMRCRFSKEDLSILKNMSSNCTNSLPDLSNMLENHTEQIVKAIEGLKTKENSIEEITEESFNTHCMFAETSVDDFTVVNINGREWVGSSDIILNFERLAINNKVGQNILLKGAPGTGKTALAEAFVDAMIKRDGGTPEENKLLVVFNQNTDYADFICGLVPGRKSGEFKVQHGLFKKFCDEAAKHRDKMYYCIIDEFSRGNTEAILGEALVTLEKRGVTVPLGKFTGETLMVPENIVIIATMNSVDRSTKYIDNATSNRFRTLKVNPIWQSDYCYDAIIKIAFKDGIDNDASECLNRVITVMQKIDSSIGKKDNNNRIGTRALQNKLGNLENLKLSLETRLIPNIEYVSEMLGMNFEAELEELRELAK